MRLETVAANAAAEAVGRLLDGGFLRVYGEAGWLIADCRLSNPAFGEPTDGTIAARKIEPVTARGGVARGFRAVASDGETVVFSGDSSELALSNSNIQPNAHFSIDSFIYTHHKETPK